MSAALDPAALARHGDFIPEFGEAVADLLAAQPGERVLDLGCGDGQLTGRLVATGATVTGIDIDAGQVDAARARGIDARLLDARSLAAESRYDAVFSNATLDLIRPAESVVTRVFAALVPGGRFVGEFGGFGSLAAIRRALHAACRRLDLDPGPRDPWYFPSGPAWRSVLATAGFAVGEVKVTRRPTILPTDLFGWLGAFAGAFTVGLDPASARALFTDVEDSLRATARHPRGHWTLDYVQLRFSATRPA